MLVPEPDPRALLRRQRQEVDVAREGGSPAVLATGAEDSQAERVDVGNGAGGIAKFWRHKISYDVCT